MSIVVKLEVSCVDDEQAERFCDYVRDFESTEPVPWSEEEIEDLLNWVFDNNTLFPELVIATGRKEGDVEEMLDSIFNGKVFSWREWLLVEEVESLVIPEEELAQNYSEAVDHNGFFGWLLAQNEVD